MAFDGQKLANEHEWNRPEKRPAWVGCARHPVERVRLAWVASLDATNLLLRRQPSKPHRIQRSPLTKWRSRRHTLHPGSRAVLARARNHERRVRRRQSCRGRRHPRPPHQPAELVRRARDAHATASERLVNRLLRQRDSTISTIVLRIAVIGVVAASPRRLDATGPQCPKA